MIATGVAVGVSALTLAGMTAIGLWATRDRTPTTESLVSAPGEVGAPVLTASLVATNLGAWVLFSPAEAGGSYGGLPAIAGYAVGAALPLLAFVPLGVRLRRLVPHGHSLVAFVRARYGRRMASLLLVVSVVYMFVFLAAEVTGAAAALEFVAGVPPWVTAGLLCAAVVAYVGYGGLVASIVTDTVQVLVILPVLVMGLAGTVLVLGGTDAIYADVVRNHGSLLDWSLDGLRFGLAVALAVLAANATNQGFWERVYAASDEETLRRSFVVAGLASVPVVFLAGLFGVQAVGLELVATGRANVALFSLVRAAFAPWLLVVVVAVTVLLVSSTVDSLLVGLTDLLRTDSSWFGSEAVLVEERLVAAAVAVAATAVGTLQLSEIELFLAVDLLCAAVFVPVVAGLYTGRVTERAALTGSLAGMVAGVLLDPWVRSFLRAASGPVGSLPNPGFARAFFAAFLVAATPVLASAAVGGSHVPLDDVSGRLEGEKTDSGGDGEQRGGRS
ncbi:MAG: sodium:proline symporter [Halobacteriaceae archaeon]